MKVARETKRMRGLKTSELIINTTRQPAPEIPLIGAVPSAINFRPSVSFHFAASSLSSQHPSPLCAHSQKKSRARFLRSLQTTSSVSLCLATSFLKVFQGKNLIHLIDRPDGAYCFRLQKDRVYYVSEESMRLSISVARPNLVSLGTCFGKFSKSGKFKLHITALDYIAKYAKYKVRIQSSWSIRRVDYSTGVDKT